MNEPVVIGIDAGGTSTRALVRTLDGELIGAATEEGANPNSHPPSLAAERIARAARNALGEADPSRVVGAVLGLAGESKLVDPAVKALFDRAWFGIGVACPLTVVGDAAVAFASATHEPNGTALIAGTGSAAARIADNQQIKFSGGIGWLLGDEGSGFWLGREAVRVTLRVLSDGHALTGLTETTYAETVGGLLPDADYAARRAAMSQVITAVNAEPPIRLSRFAPLVSAAATAGDGVAGDILDRAVEHLREITLNARGDDTGPVVLAGGLIGPGGPLTERLRARLGESVGGEVLLAKDGAAGAAWLAQTWARSITR